MTNIIAVGDSFDKRWKNGARKRRTVRSIEGPIVGFSESGIDRAQKMDAFLSWVRTARKSTNNEEGSNESF